MFDPNIPATSAEATSAMFRGQFNGLKDLIDAVQSVTAAQVDAVTNLPRSGTCQVPGENGTWQVPLLERSDAMLNAANTLVLGLAWAGG